MKSTCFDKQKKKLQIETSKLTSNILTLYIVYFNLDILLIDAAIEKAVSQPISQLELQCKVQQLMLSKYCNLVTIIVS